MGEAQGFCAAGASRQAGLVKGSVIVGSTQEHGDSMRTVLECAGPFVGLGYCLCVRRLL